MNDKKIIAFGEFAVSCHNGTDDNFYITEYEKSIEPGLHKEGIAQPKPCR